MDFGNECYYIPHLNYTEAVNWHLDKLSSLGWEGGGSNDFVPFSFFYTNVTTVNYDKPGVGLLIKI